MAKWYATIDKQSSYIDDPDECVWTVSRDPNTTGWNTDSGHSGYGLTKADAEELANATDEVEQLWAALDKMVPAVMKWGSFYIDDNGVKHECNINKYIADDIQSIIDSVRNKP